MTRRYVFGMAAYLVAFAIAFVNVAASLILIVVLALLFALPEPGERRTTLKRVRHGIR